MKRLCEWPWFLERSECFTISWVCSKTRYLWAITLFEHRLVLKRYFQRDGAAVNFVCECLLWWHQPGMCCIFKRFWAEPVYRKQSSPFNSLPKRLFFPENSISFLLELSDKKWAKFFKEIFFQLKKLCKDSRNNFWSINCENWSLFLGESQAGAPPL